MQYRRRVFSDVAEELEIEGTGLFHVMIVILVIIVLVMLASGLLRV